MYMKQTTPLKRTPLSNILANGALGFVAMDILGQLPKRQMASSLY